MTKRLLAAPLLVGLIVLAGCGGSNDNSTSSGGGTPPRGLRRTPSRVER